MKNKKLILAAALGLALLTAILAVSGGIKQNPDNTSVKPVKVLISAKEYHPATLEYLGTVEAREMVKFGFKTGGTINNIYIEKGDEIKTGDVLARLETRDLELSISTAKSTYLKSESSYSFAQDQYNKIEELHLSGAFSKQELDKAKLELDIQRANFNSARADLEYKENMLKDASLFSGLNGYVVDIMYKEGEITASGYPVVIVRSRELNVRLGLSQNDLRFVKADLPVSILFDGAEYQGRVGAINNIPDTQTRTYNVDIELGEEISLPLGSIVKAYINADRTEGIYIPINCIMNDGQDYVYVVNMENKAVKRFIKTGEIRGPRVKAQGLQEGDRVVITGMKRLKDGDTVNILPE